MGEIPSFEAFYRAVHHGREPFPWQRRLASLVERSGWPTEIGVPTGLGKTSCIDIAVWALARQADRAPAERVAPTRIWYVVNRRLLVDAGYDHGCRLAALLADPSRLPATDLTEDGPVEVLREMAAALASLRGGAGAHPLHVTRLRGGAELGARPPDSSQPALVFATVPMFASRWLFRGFGTSAGMRPVDAALAGTDTVVLLDESHLARPLLHLAEPLAECDAGDPAVVLPAPRSRPVMVSLTATGDASAAFTLDADDEAHPIVRRRLDATKPIRLVGTREKAVVETIVGRVVENLDGRRPSTAVVFVNAPRTARAVFGRLVSHEGPRSRPFDADVELLTGRVRDREGDGVRARVLDPATGAPAGRSDRRGRGRHLVVVATQTLEVGADLDFDVLVTEACGARALTQRLGRLNRLGDIDDAAGAVVFAEDAKTFGVYGDEPQQVWRRLVDAAHDGVVELGPATVAEAVGQPDDVPDRVGELLPAHVWEWVKTTTPPPGEAPPELFFSGFDRDLANVSVIWRVAVPDDGGEVRPPLSAAESVEVPLWEARDALTTLCGETVARLRPDRVTVERVPMERLSPGDQVVVPAGAGGYDRYGWAPDAREPVFDVSLLRPPGIPLLPDALRSLVGAGDELDAAVALAAQLAAVPEPDENIDLEACTVELCDRLLAAGPSPALRPAEWGDLLANLRPQVHHPIDGPARLMLRTAARRTHGPPLRADAFDELSFTATSAVLTDHLGSVGELAGKIGTRIGLPATLVEAVVTAGRFHDLGKHDVRFQRWLDPSVAAPRPMAKSSRPWHQWQRDRRAAGWPQGGRHEELSRRLVVAWLDGRSVGWDPDLVLHLVVSHHGSGRPLVAPVVDEVPIAVVAEIDGMLVSVSGDLSEVDWDQPARFRRCCERYGYWGLALLEAVVRQADHEASAVVVA